MSIASQPHRVGPFRGIMLALAGTGTLLLTSLEIRSRQQFEEQARRAEGTVVALYAGPAHPKIEFEDAKGEKVTFPGGGWTSHRTGDHVKVLFLADDPLATAELDEPGSHWVFTSATGVVGLGLLVGGLGMLLRRPYARKV
jgi:hypothetical protein